MPEATSEPRHPRRPFRDADEADVFRDLKHHAPGSGAALQRSEAEGAMRKAAEDA